MGKARDSKIGSITYQVQEALKEVQIFGVSKYEMKQAFKEYYDGSRSIDKFMHKFGKVNGINGIETFKAYLSISVRAAEYIKETFGVKDIKNINADHVKSYMDSQADKSRSSINTYKAGLEKFESALTVKYGQKYDFKLSEQSFKNSGNKERSGTYSYENPDAMIKALENNNKLSEKIKVAANIVRESGVRFHKTFILGSLKIGKDGTVYCKGKGGRYVEMSGYKELSKETLSRLSKVAVAGKFSLTDRDYKTSLRGLRLAAEETKQKYEAWHSFKKNFAHDTRDTIMTEKKVSYTDAVKDKEYIQSLEHNRELSTYQK